MEALFLIGRILFGGFFIFSGINHFMKLGMMTGYAQSKKVPMAKAGVLVSGALLIAGGLGVLLGIYVQWASLALIVALVPISLMLHNFWAISDPQQRMTEMTSFMKNIAFIGAALMFMRFGAETWPMSVVLSF